MDYNALIQNRKSAREFTDKKVTEAVCNQLEAYYRGGCQRLVPDIATELWIFGDEITEGMRREIDFCKNLNIKTRAVKDSDIKKVLGG